MITTKQAVLDPHAHRPDARADGCEVRFLSGYCRLVLEQKVWNQVTSDLADCMIPPFRVGPHPLGKACRSPANARAAFSFHITTAYSSNGNCLTVIMYGDNRVADC